MSTDMRHITQLKTTLSLLWGEEKKKIYRYTLLISEVGKKGLWSTRISMWVPSVHGHKVL